jgi:NAD(P)-dependent dehydrogenase (short-subunit alcohol dehydrogenase family)
VSTVAEQQKQELNEQKQANPDQQQQPPGTESEMIPRPQTSDPEYKPAGKLMGKVALVTGGDSGIGRSVAVYFAKEGADIAIVYLNEHDDANETKALVEKEGRTCLLMPGDAGDEEFCFKCVEKVVRHLGHLDIVVNNAAQQFPQESIEQISIEQLDRTFKSNIYSYFFMVKAALPHLREGATIINTASVTAYRGSPKLLDYSSTKGAIVAFTRSLALSLAEKKIRVNGVAPGPIWTPLITSTFEPDKIKEFGNDTALGRAGQPSEVAPCFVFLASQDASYITGQFLHPNGGEVVNT